MKIELPQLMGQVELDALASTLGIKTTAAKVFLEIALENVILMDRKQIDYGSRNISGFGLVGVVVRMNDKMERIKNILGKGRTKKALNESIRDSFRDISNYGIIALMVESKRWPTD